MIRYPKRYYGGFWRGVHVTYINIIKDIYGNASTNIKIMGEDTEAFPITVGLH